MKLITPISHLFQDLEVGRALSLVSDGLEARPDISGVAGSVWPAKTTHIHFSEPQLDAHLLWNESQKSKILEAIERLDPDCLTLSFHLSRDFYGPKMGRNGRYLPSGFRLELDEMRRNCDVNMAWLRESCGATILFENNNYYDTGAYDIVCQPQSIKQLVNEFADGLLLDIAHGVVSADNLGKSRPDYFEPLLECDVRQVHLSAPARKGAETVDSHELPDMSFVSECESLLDDEVHNWPPITVEYYKSSEELLFLLKQLRVRDATQ